MSLSQLIAQTVLMFKVDASQMKQELKNVQGQEKEALHQVISTTEQRNKSYDSWAKNITEVNAAIGLATKGIQFATEAWQQYEKWAKQAGGADAARAAEFRKSLDSWSDGLKNIEVGFGRLVTSAGGLVDALGQVAYAIGDIMQAIPPELMDALTTPVWTKLLDSRASQDARKMTAENQALLAQIDAMGAADLQAARDRKASDYATPDWATVPRTTYDASQASKSVAWANLAPGFQPGKKKPGRGGGGDNGPLFFVTSEDGGTPVPVYKWGGYADAAWQAPTAAQRAAGRSFSDSYGAGGLQPLGAIPSSFSFDARRAGVDAGDSATKGLTGAVGDLQKLAMQFAEAGRANLMEKIFGPIDEINGYQVAFSAITSTVSAAYDALITGSESVGKAARAALAGEIEAFGKRALIRALQETGEGVAALATPFGGAAAAAHFKSAAIFGLEAVAAGVAAHELGAGGAGGGGGSGGAVAAATRGGGQYQRPPENIVIYQGDYFSDSNPRRQVVNTGRAIRAAKREIESGRGVSDA